MKKPYYIKVENNGAKAHFVVIYAGNGIRMFEGEAWYNTKREANQMARRLSENLGIEIKEGL